MSVKKFKLMEWLEEMQEGSQPAVPFEGLLAEDQNIPGNILVISSRDSIWSFSKDDIVSQEPTDSSKERMRVWVRVNALGLSARLFRVEPSPVSFMINMEHVAAPLAVSTANKPAKGAAKPRNCPNLQSPTLKDVADGWTSSCVGNHAESNNCAHYLSDAFICAGFNELLPPNDHINARCQHKRPIRARDMWSWFQSKATQTSRTPARNTGWWAVFQLKESEYWGGHVTLLDSDSWTYYGTEWYENWDQYLYKW